MVEIAALRVFGRWGELVFERKNFKPDEPNAGWDGVFRGRKLPAAVYAWAAEARLLDGRTVRLHSDVALVR